MKTKQVKSFFKNHKMKFLIGIPVIFISFFTQMTSAFADIFEDNPDVTKFLLDRSDFMKYTDNPAVPIFNSLKWGAVKALFWVSDSLENLVPKSMDLLKILEDSGIAGVRTQAYTVAITSILVVGITIIGYKFVIQKDTISPKNVALNLILAVLLMGSLPTILSSFRTTTVSVFNGFTAKDAQFNDVQKDDIDLLPADQKKEALERATEGLSFKLIRTNTVDLVYALANDPDSIKNTANADITTKTKRNNMNKTNFKNANFGEVLLSESADEYKEIKGTARDSLEHYLTQNGKGNDTVSKVDGGGLLGFFNDSFKGGYLRYTGRSGVLAVALIALIVANFFAIWVIAQCALELGVKSILANFVFASDLETGQKTKMVFQDICSLFLQICGMGFSLMMFGLFTQWIINQNLPLFLYLVAQWTATITLIKGSETIARYFGVETGFRQGIGNAMALAGTTYGAVKAGQWAGGKASAGIDKAKEIAPKVGEGLASGARKMDKGIADSARAMGMTKGYIGERGMIGGINKASSIVGDKALDIGKNAVDTVQKPINAVGSKAKGIQAQFQEGEDSGISQGVSENARDNKLQSIRDKHSGMSNHASATRNYTNDDTHQTFNPYETNNPMNTSTPLGDKKLNVKSDMPTISSKDNTINQRTHAEHVDRPTDLADKKLSVKDENPLLNSKDQQLTQRTLANTDNNPLNASDRKVNVQSDPTNMQGTTDTIRQNVTTDGGNGQVNVSDRKVNVQSDPTNMQGTTDTIRQNVTTDGGNGQVNVSDRKVNVQSDPTNMQGTTDTIRQNVTTDGGNGQVNVSDRKVNVQSDPTNVQGTTDTIRQNVTTEGGNGQVNVSDRKVNVQSDPTMDEIDWDAVIDEWDRKQLKKNKTDF